MRYFDYIITPPDQAVRTGTIAARSREAALDALGAANYPEGTHLQLMEIRVD